MKLNDSDFEKNNPAYFLPGVEERELDLKIIEYGDKKLEIPAMNVNALKKCLEFLKSSRKNFLLKKNRSQIQEVLNKSIELFLNPSEFKTLAEHTMKFSPQMNEKILNEMMSAFKKDISKVEVSEGNTELIVCVHGEIPGPGTLSIIQSLLNKSAIFCKTSSIFTALFAQSIAEIDEDVANCVAVANWESGKPENKELEEYIFGERTKNDTVVFFGNPEISENIIKILNPTTRFIPFTHGLSFGIIGNEMLTKKGVEKIALDAALAVSMYDQLACFSPQIYYVERGGEISPEEFCEILARKINEIELMLPRGELSPDESARMSTKINTYRLQNLAGMLKLHEIKNNGRTVGGVIYQESKKVEHSPFYRVIIVNSINNVSEVPGLIEDKSGYIHTVGIELDKEKEDELIDKLKKNHATRITRIGDMFKPSILDYKLF
jgi:hypothetical protein